MNASNLGQYDPMVRVAASGFRCAVCGHSKPIVGWMAEGEGAITVRLQCPSCGNHHDWRLQLHIPEALRN